jgi:CBS domain-containing protein
MLMTNRAPITTATRFTGMSDALSTLERLDDAAAAKVLDADDVSSLRDCFQYLLRFRWQSRARAWLNGGAINGTVSLSDLAPQQRAVLRTVAREVAGIRRKLTSPAATPSYR